MNSPNAVGYSPSTLSNGKTAALDAAAASRKRQTPSAPVYSPNETLNQMTQEVVDIAYSFSLVIDVLNVEGNEYKDVVKMRIRHRYDSSYLYYADGVGLIKKQKIIRDTITETSNLLRYNTILRPY